MKKIEARKYISWKENGELLFTIDKMPDFNTILRHNNKYYTICSMSHENGIISVEEKQIDISGEEKDYENYLTCPFCGHEDKDSFELSDSSDDHECGSCGSVFSYEREIEVTYSSYPVKLNEVVDV